jgi:hypothetical protein
MDNLSSTTLLTIEPYENQKFWTPIISSDVGRNPAKLKSSSPLSEVLIFVIMIRFELDLHILIPYQSNHYPLTPSRPNLYQKICLQIGISKWQQELQWTFNWNQAQVCDISYDQERWAQMKPFCIVEIIRLRTKVHRSMNSCNTFVHLGPYMLVCAYVCNILSHTVSLFLWWRLENELDIWLIPLVVMKWVCLMLKLSSKWGLSYSRILT